MVTVQIRYVTFIIRKTGRDHWPKIVTVYSIMGAVRVVVGARLHSAKFALLRGVDKLNSGESGQSSESAVLTACVSFQRRVCSIVHIAA